MFRNGAVATLSILVLSVAALFANSHRGLAQSPNQSAPDLSGTWELVEIKGAMKLKPTERGFPRLMLVISQEGSQLRVTQKRTVHGTERASEYSYYTDGRGETNFGRIESWPYERKTESVSGWQQERLLIKYTAEFTLLSPERGARRKDEWRLGSNGRTLILTRTTVRSASGSTDDAQTVSVVAGFEKRKLIFRRI